MDLADGRRSDWNLIKFIEELFQRLALFLFDDLTDRFEIVSGSVGLKLRQFICEFGADQIRASAKQLPKLDESWAKLRQGAANSLGLSQL